MVCTIRKLSEMTDEASFERLAMAILREAQPEYAALLHPGVNSAGKTVKAPVDGISFVRGAEPPHMIAAHHTTCKRDDLRKKWLHDPVTVTPRRGRQPGMPAGDLIKTAKIVAVEKERDPSLRATLVLTTNQEPPEDLVRDTRAAGEAHGLDIDIWSVSRLAHVLDNTSSGQWLRRQFLGIEQERLSPELLAKLSRDSLNIHRPGDNPIAWVSRDLDRAIAGAVAEQDVTFIIAESGLGKSVACYKWLDHYVAAGGCGLILPHKTLVLALTIEEAIDTALRQLHPRLTAGAALDALSLCSADCPLVLVVEDINKSGQAPFLAEKIAKWSFLNNTTVTSNGRASRERWRLLCPLWPQIASSLGDVRRKQVERLAVMGAALTVAEGREAVQRHARLKGVFLSDLDADSISEALGHDPLLIALQEPGSGPHSERIIEQFIDASVTRLANERGDYTASDYRTTLRLMAGVMLSHRELSPSWTALLGWLAGDSGASAMLRYLVHHGEVIRLSGTATKQFLVFRHDRVRDSLFSDAIVAMIQSGTLSDDVLAEPYFAEVVGTALLYDDIPVAFVDRVRGTNPLALFHTLRLIREPSAAIHHAVLAAIEVWLADPKTHATQHANLRLEALSTLSRTESSKVVALVRKFKETPWTSWQARFRNGDVVGGLQLCLELPPGIGAVSRDQQIEHAKTHFGSKLRSEIDHLLRLSDLGDKARVGALRLAGHLADPKLAEAIESSWNLDAKKGEHLEDYLWACAQCCGEEPDRFLAPVCDAWAALSAEHSDNRPSPRENLAAHSVRSAFHKDAPVSAVGYFIKRAKTEDLHWPITYMLHGVDHPDALEFVIRELAEIDRQLEGTESISPFSITAADEWERRQEEQGRQMSRESRERVLALWQNHANDKYVRKHAFRFWATTEVNGDLDIMRSVDVSDSIADSVLWQRLRRKDSTAIYSLLCKLQGNVIERGHWWPLTRSLWCDELAKALEEELTVRGASVGRAWDSKYGTDYSIYNLIMALPAAEAEALLLKHWDHLRFCDLFVHVALYVATPSLLDLVEQVIQSCPDPKELFKHIDFNYGIRERGRAGVTHRRQIEALVPYLDYLDDLTIYTFWQLCNERGWFDLRRQLFDDRVSSKYSRLYLDEGQIVASLNTMVQNKQFYWIDHWIDDYLKTGVSSGQVINFIGKWLATQKSFAALKLAAGAVVHVGQRRDLQILEVTIEPKDAAAALLVDTAFAVKRRSLG